MSSLNSICAESPHAKEVPSDDSTDTDSFSISDRENVSHSDRPTPLSNPDPVPEVGPSSVAPSVSKSVSLWPYRIGKRCPVTENLIIQMYKGYCIPDQFDLQVPSEYATHLSEPPRGYVSFNVAFFEVGVRLPLHPFLVSFLERTRFSPGQITPNAWAILLGYLVTCKVYLQTPPDMDLFLNIAICKWRDAAMYFGIESHHRTLPDLPTSNKGWKDRLLYVRGLGDSISSKNTYDMSRIHRPDLSFRQSKLLQALIRFGKHPVREILSAENLSKVGVGPMASFVNDLLSKPIVSKKRKAAKGASKPSTDVGQHSQSLAVHGEPSRTPQPKRGRSDDPPVLEHSTIIPDPIAKAASQPDETSMGSGKKRDHRFDTATECLHKSVIDDMSLYRHKSITATLIDHNESLAKVLATSTRIVSSLARLGEVSAETLRDILTTGHDEAMHSEHQVSDLKEELSVLHKRSDEQIFSLQADVKTRDNVIESLKLDLERERLEREALDNKYNQTMSDLEVKLTQLQSAKQGEDMMKADLAASRKELQDLQDYCKAHIPQLRKNSYRACIEIFLKKIIHTYPGADLVYFSDISDVPDVTVNEEYLEVEMEGDAVDTNAEAEDVINTEDVDIIGNLERSDAIRPFEEATSL